MTYSGDVRVGGPADVRELPGLVLSKIAVGPMSNNSYLLRCRETGQQILIDVLAEEIRKGQLHNSVRRADPRQLAAMIVLIAQSTIQSGQIVEPILDADALGVELAHTLNGYLCP